VTETEVSGEPGNKGGRGLHRSGEPALSVSAKLSATEGKKTRNHQIVEGTTKGAAGRAEKGSIWGRRSSGRGRKEERIRLEGSEKGVKGSMSRSKEGQKNFLITSWRQPQPETRGNKQGTTEAESRHYL